MTDIIEKTLRILPQGIQKMIFEYRCKRRDPELHKRILEYYKNKSFDSLSDEKKEVISYLERNPLNVFPYDFRRKYLSMKVKVFSDKERDLFFVLYDNKKLYFKRGFTKKQVKRNFLWLKMEQDINSPHRYLSEKVNVSKGDVIIDAGAAEGIFALSVIDLAEKIYLFETDTAWIEALNATFSPWSDKVVIINKFISDKDDDSNVTLDSMFNEEMKVDFIKIDVDGAEADLLKGCNRLLSNSKPLKLALCTYHLHKDEDDFSKLLLSKKFALEYSKGYMIYLHDKLESPYLRRGLVRASRSA